MHMHSPDVERPRVLIYRSELLPKSETFIREQASALTGWTPIFVGERELAQGLDLSLFQRHTTLPPPSGRLRKLLYRCCRRLDVADPFVLRGLARLRPSLIHAHFGTFAVDIATYAKRLNLPLLVTLHGYDVTTSPCWWEAKENPTLVRLYPKRFRRLGAMSNVRFIAASRHLRECAIAFGAPDHKIDVCHTGIDLRRFAPGITPWSQRPKQIVFVGRLVEVKGVDILLRAYSVVQNLIAGAELLIIGDGALRATLERLATELQLRNCRFIGEQTHEFIRDTLQHAYALCLPSVTASNGCSEGFGMVLLEAQACGLPVVSSAPAGRNEAMIDGTTGFAFPEGDVAQLALLLSRLLSDDGLAADMGVEARRFVERNFDIDLCTKRLSALYQRACTV